ncbi:hypothetical protein B0J13DRAFT_424041, partial [Dactylonectria estremocensis]
VNTFAQFFLVKEFLPWMIRQNYGHVIMTASMAGYVTVASNVDDSYSKASVLAFHEGLTQELKYMHNAPRDATRHITAN